MRQPDFSPRHLPAEWLEAIHEAQIRKASGSPPPIKREDRIESDRLGIYEHSSELELLVTLLKRKRIEVGMSLGDIARATQQSRSAISRLENGRYPNPTLHTLFRYARALGLHIKLSTRPVTDEPGTMDGGFEGGRV